MYNRAFLKHVYACPTQLSEAVLAASAANPDFQILVEDIRAFDREISAVVNAVSIPAGLKNRLRGIPHKPVQVR